MNWDAIGATGELLGFFAILVTLVYLGMQTRIAQKTSRTQSYRDVINDFQNTWSALQNPDTARIIRIAVNDWNTLSHNEQMVAHSFFVGLIVHFTNAVELEEQLPELAVFISGWEDNILGLLQTKGGAAWYEQASYLFLQVVTRRLASRMAGDERLPPPWNHSMGWWTLDDSD